MLCLRTQVARRRRSSAAADGGTAGRTNPAADGGTAWRSAAAHTHFNIVSVYATSRLGRNVWYLPEVPGTQLFAGQAVGEERGCRDAGHSPAHGSAGRRRAAPRMLAGAEAARHRPGTTPGKPGAQHAPLVGPPAQTVPPPPPPAEPPGPN